MKFEIQCGQIKGIFDGRTHEIAFRNKAMKKYQKPYLGKLMRFREVDEEGKPARDFYFRQKFGEGSGKWKYQNPLAILNKKK